VFFDKRELIEYLKLPMFKNSFICATNLGFDFYGTFYETEEVLQFMTQWRGSGLIFARTYLDKEGFHIKKPNQSAKTLTFVDTLNYAKLSVKDMGKILELPKLEQPKSLGRLPKTDEEKQELIIYNIRDSEISYKFVRFLFESFTELGASPKLTIASTSMSLYKNHYLNDVYFQHDIPELLEQFKSYYGGRTEAFKRGEIRKANYYDFNSLYPSVMLNEFPDPNSIRRNRLNDISYIESYEGVAHVDVEAPNIDIPLLPFRSPENKLLFPTGSFSCTASVRR
jgi:hypothetical protein